nr:MAG TPA: hypothetical protein [Caudoviricetes sp.]DAU56542.1 MAG TPA: hypothetical protein [Caudoviricetes sp.]
MIGFLYCLYHIICIYICQHKTALISIYNAQSSKDKFSILHKRR